MAGSGTWIVGFGQRILAMLVKLNISALSETRWYQYLVRFLLGGLITAGAGIIAKKFGQASEDCFWPSRQFSQRV